ncbi:hypothetical protein KCU91_g15910, partial [Aureobasidium melanogenum]
MARPQSSASRHSRQNTDQAPPQARNTAVARAHNTRSRRPSVRRQHQHNRHHLSEEDRFLELRRSARIATQQQDQLREAQAQEQHQDSTMADVARRTYARNDHGPRSVEHRRSSTRTDTSTHSRQQSSASPYTLTITCAPPSSVSPSTPFTTRILITTPRRRTPQNLLAVVSLTSASGTPLPAGHLLTTSPSAKLMDSVSEPSRSDISALGRTARGEIVGAAGFEGLCVREQGEYRVRVTIARMEGDGWEAVAEVDSGVFRVVGRSVNGVKC